ncbi:hypothetical protein [Streptomyces coelicoflavus]|uniref:hypothetical protein n=1 Tax=Streptomyces coelicoflavus TaxID=285562 RepID=UPI003F4A48AB
MEHDATFQDDGCLFLAAAGDGSHIAVLTSPAGPPASALVVQETARLVRGVGEHLRTARLLDSVR